jgi:hypothetical protein
MNRGPAYPTGAHERAADEIVAFFAADERTDAVLLTNSCARGKATPDSCLDVHVLASESESLQARWDDHAATSAAIAELRRAGRFSDLHLDVGTGDLAPGPIEEEGLDLFEVAVGNLLVHAVPLWTTGTRLDELRAAWLPYYDEPLRLERLAAVRRYCLGNLDHVSPCLDRELWFQAFDRLYRGFEALLMGVHIARRTYPIAYNKWIREQIEERLGLPELYAQLPPLLEVSRLESRQLESRAADLRRLVAQYLV